MTDLSTPGIEEIERQLRAPATSFRELLLAGSVFARLADAIDAEPPTGVKRVSDDTSLRYALPNRWPTVGDLRKLRDALVVAGWRKDETF